MSRMIVDLLEEVQNKCTQLLQRSQAAGFPLLVTQTYRSMEEQEGIYAKGRTRPGEPCEHSGVMRPVGTCGVHPLGLTVTQARAGDSWHNYHRAFDVVFLTSNNAISWSGPWEDVGVLGEELELEWGGRWKIADQPHFEYHPGITLAQMKMRGKPLQVLNA